mgnify:FL=1
MVSKIIVFKELLIKSLEAFLDSTPVVIHLDMTKIEEEHSTGRSIIAGIYDVQHQIILTAIGKTRRVSYIWSTDERNVTSKKRLSKLAESLH